MKKWKLVLAVVLILGIGGLLFFTDVGQRYTGPFGKMVGDFFSVLTHQTPTEGAYTITLVTTLAPFYEQSYAVSNALFTATGGYQIIRINDQVITPKTGVVVMTANTVNGIFEVTKTGSIKLSGSTNYFEIGDYVFSGINSRIEVEIVPTEFTVNNIAVNKMSFGAVTGSLTRIYGSRTDQVSLENSVLDIAPFIGGMIMKDGLVTLTGSSSSVIGDKFSFTA
jgi:hypothetical protein